MKLKHPLILVDLNDGKARIHCPVAAQLAENDLRVVKTLIAEAAKHPDIFSGYESGRYEVKFTKLNRITRKLHVDLNLM